MPQIEKLFADTVKMIAYRAETTGVGLLRPNLADPTSAVKKTTD